MLRSSLTVDTEENTVTIAPQNPYSERGRQAFEGTFAPSMPGGRGPLRFEEGIATDTDVPADFARGAYADPTFAPGRLNHANPDAQFKHASETMRERAHLGSAAWVDSPALLGDFVEGAGVGQRVEFERVQNPMDRRVNRAAPTVITG